MIGGNRSGSCGVGLDGPQRISSIWRGDCITTILKNVLTFYAKRE